MKIFLSNLLLLFCLCLNGQQNYLEQYVLKEGEDITQKINRNTFISVTANRSSCHEGEPVVITCKYYSRVKTELTVTHYPSLNGFSVIDLNERDQQNIENINGREYLAYTIQKIQGYPLQPGVIMVEPLEVDITAYFIKEEYFKSHSLKGDDIKDFDPDKFPAEGLIRQRIIIKSKPLQVTVLPLPEKSRPGNFKGAVGVFSITSEVEKKQMSAGEKNTLTITVDGRGNMQLLNSPDVVFPGKAEFFEPVISDKLNNYSIPVSGSKVFEYPFVINDTGRFVFEPVSFSYFNTDIKAYTVCTSKPVEITVTPSAGEVKTITAAVQKEEKNWISTFFSNRAVVVSAVSLLILAGLVTWVRADKKKEKAEKKKQEKARAAQYEKEKEEQELLEQMKNPLEKSMQLMLEKDEEGFYKTLHYEFKTFLSKRLRIPAHSISIKSLAELMDREHYATETAVLAARSLSEIEQHIFTPGLSGSNPVQVYENAEKVVNEMRKI